MNQTWIVDFDDTLALTNLGFIKTAKRLFNDEVTMADVTSWGFWHSRPYGDYLWSKECFANAAWTARLSPAPYSVELVTRLHQEGNTVIVLSDRPAHHLPWLEAWLEGYGFPAVEVLVTNLRHSKADMAMDNGATHIVDDSPEQLNSFFKEATDEFEHIYAMDHPYNQHLTLPANATRVASLLDILRITHPTQYAPSDAATLLV